MAEQSTFIKLDRNISRWRWWHNHNTLVVFLCLLITANVTDHEFEHEIIHRGEVATSIKNIANMANLTFQQTRTAFLHLKSTGEITSRSCNRYQVITIVNYDKYQENQQAKQQTNQHSINKQSTSKQQQYKNIKNDKNEKNNTPLPPKGGKSPSGNPKRGTDAFRNKSHLLLKPDEGTGDDIPVRYREMFGDDFAAYWGYRNQ